MGINVRNCSGSLYHRTDLNVRYRPGYIAGVTNPIFESAGSWDLLCDVGSGRMVVSKDILTNHPPTATGVAPVQLVVRSGTLKAEGSAGSEEELVRPSKDLTIAQKAELLGKAETTDNLFMEDVSSRWFLLYRPIE